jgi:general secretion pathway protein A
MYTEFFGLKKRPFVLSPDPEFLYLSRVHGLAFTQLEFGLTHHSGFIVLTGETGTGKTTLLKYLFQKVKASLEIATIVNTQLDPQALLEMLVKEFELNSPSRNKAALVDVLFRHFIKHCSRGTRCVIVVDEAQNLSLEAFEELRMLSNLELGEALRLLSHLEVGTDVLVQIILVGQPQLRERLSHPSLAQLTQRVSVHYHLTSLSRDEVGSYITHRLSVAGYARPEPLFTEGAVARLAETSRGIPRVINALCDASLTHAFTGQLAQVPEEIVEKVIADSGLLLVGFRPDEPKAASEGNEQGNRRQHRYRLLSDEPEASSESSPTDLEVAEVTPAAVPAEYEPPLVRLIGRLEALEVRLQMLESDRKNDVVAVLQEMLEKERERAFQYAQQINSLVVLQDMLEKERERASRYAQQIESLNVEYREVHSELTWLKRQLLDSGTRPQLTDKQETHSNGGDADPPLPQDKERPPHISWGRRHAKTLTVLVIVAAALGFLFRMRWDLWSVFDLSDRQFLTTGVSQEPVRRAKIPSPPRALADVSAGKGGQPNPEDIQAGLDLSNEALINEREGGKGSQKSAHRAKIPPVPTTVQDGSARNDLPSNPQETQMGSDLAKEGLIPGGAPDRGALESDHRSVIPPDAPVPPEMSTSPEGQSVRRENQSKLDPNKGKVIPEQEAEKAAQAWPLTPVVGESSGAEMRPIVVPPLSSKADSGIEGASPVLEVQAGEIKREEISAGHEVPGSGPSPSVWATGLPAAFPGNNGTASMQPESPYHHFEIEAVQPCWVQIVIDRKKTEIALLQPGEQRAWEATKEVEVVLGNAGGVRMKWDLKPVGQVGKPGQVARFRLPQPDLTGKSP